MDNSMTTLERWIDNKIVQNIGVWVFVFIIFLALIQSDNRVLNALQFIGFLIFPIYINNIIILPLFYKKNRIVAVLLFLGNIAVFTLLGVFLLSNFFLDFEWRMVYNGIGLILLVVLFGAAVKIARDSYVKRQQIQEAELKLLKAQLNPHFLFNTLNNLYGLSVIKSDKLPSLMLQLSDLLRYSLYDTRETLVPLEKEIKYLENYVSLERIRLEDTTQIELQIEGDISQKSIAPMLLIVFVENAFKHLSDTKEKVANVKVKLVASETELQFECTNTIDSITVHSENMETGKSGIGLANVKKRLQLMYPEKYDLDIQTNDEVFKVNLKLQC